MFLFLHSASLSNAPWPFSKAQRLLVTQSMDLLLKNQSYSIATDAQLLECPNWQTAALISACLGKGQDPNPSLFSALASVCPSRLLYVEAALTKAHCWHSRHCRQINASNFVSRTYYNLTRKRNLNCPSLDKELASPELSKTLKSVLSKKVFFINYQTVMMLKNCFQVFLCFRRLCKKMSTVSQTVRFLTVIKNIT